MATKSGSSGGRFTDQLLPKALTDADNEITIAVDSRNSAKNTCLAKLNFAVFPCAPKNSVNTRLAELDDLPSLPKTAADSGISRHVTTTLKLVCCICLAIACLNPSIVRAGCGEYVFDRLHPQTIAIPGLTLYRLPYNPYDQQDHNANQFSRQLSSDVTNDNHWETDKSISLGNRFPISEVSIRYSARPVPCHGPNCRSQSERPFGMGAAVIIDFENNGPQAALSDQSLKQLLATPTDWMRPTCLSFETQFCDRLYRPPS